MKTIIEDFTKEEEKLIEKAIDKLRDLRSYGDRPRLYHDLIVDGCKRLLADEGK